MLENIYGVELDTYKTKIGSTPSIRQGKSLNFNVFKVIL